VYICELLYIFVRLGVEPVVLVLLPLSWRWSILGGTRESYLSGRKS
jgi:hypothetical protein